MGIPRQQVIVIGGGETFDTHQEYMAFLRDTLRFDPYKKRKPGWKENLQKDLGRRFEVLAPSMPNKLNAKYEEWATYFDKVLPYIKEGSPIFVGHSLGGLFLMKYLDWYQVQTYQAFTPMATMLVATPWAKEPVSGFADFGIENVHGVALGEPHVFHSHDDTIVPYSDNAINVRMWTGAHLHEMNGHGHFVHDSHFPELVSVIRKLSRARSKRT